MWGPSNKALEQTNGAMPEMEAPHATQSRCSADNSRILGRSRDTNG
jgi:hypothetical protein